MTKLLLAFALMTTNVFASQVVTKGITDSAITNAKIANGTINLTTKVTGALPIANGGTGQTSAANAINALLPTQTGNSGKFLTTDGSVSSWISGGGVSFPLQAPTSSSTPQYSTTANAGTGFAMSSGTEVDWYFNSSQAWDWAGSGAFPHNDNTFTLGSDANRYSGVYSTLFHATKNSASTPVYTFTSDTNTGIDSSGADTLDFSTGGSYKFEIDSAGHLIGKGTAPSVSSCGTSPSVSGTDTVGRITVGTGGVATSCTLTFAASWSTAPVCTIADETTSLLVTPGPTTTTLVITAATAFGASDKLAYHCLGF